MEQGVYHGSRIELLGRTALLREPFVTEPIRVISIYGNKESAAIMAQFEMNERNDGGKLNYLCFGWHAFSKDDFSIYPKPE